jgi:hypothetical protein
MERVKESNRRGYQKIFTDLPSITSSLHGDGSPSVGQFVGPHESPDLKALVFIFC